MFGGRKREPDQPGARGDRDNQTSPTLFGIYTCSACNRPLELEKVLSADAEEADRALTGFVVFQHFCACDPGAVQVSRMWGSYPAFLALFGAQPPLPYVARFAWHPVRQDDPFVARWRWELGQVADVDEFLLFLDDAAARRAT